MFSGCFSLSIYLRSHFYCLQLDKKVITKIALGEDDGKSVVKHCCDKTKHYIETVTEQTVNGTLMNVTTKEVSCKKYCKWIQTYQTLKYRAILKKNQL